jgi:signal recognition particle receptor subunit beta
MGLNKRVFKILITGNFGSGKTTFVKTASEIEPLLTEKKISTPHNKKDKETTTVAMDMGKIKIDENTEIHMFATPGQKRFDFMLDILSKGIIGAIILVDATDKTSAEDALNLYNWIKERYDIPIVFGITKTDITGEEKFSELKNLLPEEEDIRILPIDPRDRESVKKAILELLTLI